MTTDPMPPIGLRPRRFAMEDRFREVEEAVERYEGAGVSVPQEWYDERREIRAWLTDRRSTRRENPATVFIAHNLGEQVHGPWDGLPVFVQRHWIERAANLVIAMYDAGFTIPRPADPDAVWAALSGAA